MTIKIKPAEIVGANQGDRVTWTYEGETHYGALMGLSTQYPGRLVVDREDLEGVCNHIEPERLTLAPRKYEVGEEVGEADYPHLPDGTLLLRDGYLPAYKFKDRWYVIDVTDPMASQGVRPLTTMASRARTIARLPRTYRDS